MKNTLTRFTTSSRTLYSLTFFGVSLALRYAALTQTSYVNGWDGYFYINQVRSFMEEGRMDVPDSSLVYPFMMLIQLFSNDYVLSYKLLACILAAGLTMSLFLLALKWTKDLYVAILIGSLSLFSPHLTYFAAQYPKNLLGIVCFTWLLYSVDSKRKVVPVLLLVLNFFGHRVTAVLGVIFLAATAIVQRIPRFTPYVLVAFIVMFIAGGFLLPGVLSLFDIERFQGVMSSRPQFAPYSFVTSFGPNLVSRWWFIEIIVCCIIFFVALVYALIRRDIVQLPVVLVILTILIFPFFEWSTDGPALRFFLIFVLLCPVLLIFLLKSLELKYVPAVLSIVLVVAAFFSYKSYVPEKHDPPYRLYSRVSKSILANVQADSCELIIAHKSLAEYIVYSTGIDAMSWIPEYEIEPTRLWRVADGVKDVQMDFYLDREDLVFIHRLTPSYTLVREDCWNKFISRVRDDRNDELMQELANWKNPDRVRPYFMLKSKDL